jgi:hypothetical protein
MRSAKAKVLVFDFPDRDYLTPAGTPRSIPLFTAIRGNEGNQAIRAIRPSYGHPRRLACSQQVRYAVSICHNFRFPGGRQIFVIRFFTQQTVGGYSHA